MLWRSVTLLAILATSVMAYPPLPAYPQLAARAETPEDSESKTGGEILGYGSGEGYDVSGYGIPGEPTGNPDPQDAAQVSNPQGAARVPDWTRKPKEPDAKNHAATQQEVDAANEPVCGNGGHISNANAVEVKDLIGIVLADKDLDNYVRPGPGNCPIVACHHLAAVKLCNDGDITLKVNNGMVANITKHIRDKCEPGAVDNHYNGQQFFDDNRWNVILGGAAC